MSKYVGFYQNFESYGSRVKGSSFRVVLYMQGSGFWSYWSYSEHEVIKFSAIRHHLASMQTKFMLLMNKEAFSKLVKFCFSIGLYHILGPISFFYVLIYQRQLNFNGY